MKKLLSHFLAIAVALAFAGCSNDDLNGKNKGTDDNNSGDVVYMNVMVQLPVGAGSRSTTGDEGGSSDGTEVGLDRENSVYSVLLVLADAQNRLIGCAERSVGAINRSGSTVTTVQSISKSVIADYYENKGVNGELDAATQKINVFVFCNPTNALRIIFEGVAAGDETWHEQICSIAESPNGTSNNASIWGGADYNGGFLMSSSEIATKKLPSKFSYWDDFTQEDHPFLLTGKNSNIGGNSDVIVENSGAIKVERSVARFDFKDGSDNKDNTYDVVKDQDGITVMRIQLQKMALVNMSKNFYYLRRVSDDGTDTGALLCNLETSENYVVDTDAAAKNDGSIIENGAYGDHFNFCLGNPENDWTIDEYARLQWFTSKISDVLADDNQDDHQDWTGHGDYKIWRYVTENTIPGATSNQKVGISTGIVFKGKMIAPAGATGTLADALNSDAAVSEDNPILYAYGSEIFVRWTEVRAMAIKLGAISPMYKAVFGNTTVTPVAQKADGTGAVYSDDATSADAKWDAWYNQDKTSTAKLGTFKAAATDAGFTLYERSEDPDTGKGYYCYYFYWNRHNNNGNGGVMGRMEFGVVRNNVYKLAVNSIRKLGHPRISENDPDPVDPEDPDEEGDVYLSVTVEVLPWVVRVNDIDF